MLQDSPGQPRSDRGSALVADDRGAVGTEMAIVVAIVVAIALALGLAMRNSASNFQDCIPSGPSATNQIDPNC